MAAQQAATGTASPPGCEQPTSWLGWRVRQLRRVLAVRLVRRVLRKGGVGASDLADRES